MTSRLKFRSKQNWILLALLFLLLTATLAVAEESRPNRRSDYSAMTSVPESARVKKNPFEGDPREARAGGKLYQQHCAECHGAKAAGTRKAPSLLRDEVQQAPPGALFWILTNGVVLKGMPVWSKIPEPERWQIVTFLQSLHSSSAARAASGP